MRRYISTTSGCYLAPLVLLGESLELGDAQGSVSRIQCCSLYGNSGSQRPEEHAGILCTVPHRLCDWPIHEHHPESFNYSLAQKPGVAAQTSTTSQLSNRVGLDHAARQRRPD
jgi:hypothetical protein